MFTSFDLELFYFISLQTSHFILIFIIFVSKLFNNLLTNACSYTPSLAATIVTPLHAIIVGIILYLEVEGSVLDSYKIVSRNVCE